MPSSNPNAVKTEKSTYIQMYVSEESATRFRNAWNKWTKTLDDDDKDKTQHRFLNILLDLFELKRMYPDKIQELVDKYNEGY